jgi:hypothetical protein
MEMLGYAAGIERVAEILNRNSLSQTNIEFGIGLSSCHVPKFRLGLAAKAFGHVGGRMNLQRERFLRIEQFDQQWEAGRPRYFTEDFFSMRSPEFVQGFAA